MRSDLLLRDWRGNLTTFSGFYDTRPALELKNATWGHVVFVIATEDGPAPVREKERSTYFVGCCLKSAPLVNGTLAKAEKLGLPTFGKQRSAAHVTEACMIVADLDGIADAQLKAIEARLTDAALTYLVISSWSHGRPEKPGTRCRLVLPVDKALDASTYKQAAQGLNALLLDGLADPSGFALHQQQGTWSTAPERVKLAFRRLHKAGVCSADALLAAAPKTEKPRLSLAYSASDTPLPVNADRIAAALAWIDANEYSAWINAALWVKAAYGDVALPIWLRWSMTAEEAHRADEDECARVWGELQPRITPNQGAGALYGRARDEALRVARESGMTGHLDARAKAALVYLRRFHRHVLDTNFEGFAA
jgi:hypothetical protein